ncbi:hypothetical protein HAX54_023983 [Datura stramonium]|uniref:Uncharacterized protein n=1 Tax=Datura stramonium TaxID=4076 RepID=A0ABS8S603_DATST|nr:hypothetical protein [Datura stramonium]
MSRLPLAQAVDSGHIGHRFRLIWIFTVSGRLHEISLVLSKEDVLPLGGRRHMLESLKDICDAFFAKKAENRKRGPGPCKQNTIQAPMHLSKVDIRPKRES